MNKEGVGFRVKTFGVGANVCLWNKDGVGAKVLSSSLSTFPSSGMGFLVRLPPANVGFRVILEGDGANDLKSDGASVRALGVGARVMEEKSEGVGL